MSLILLPLNSAKDAVLVEQKFGTSFAVNDDSGSLTVDTDDGSLSTYHKPDYSQLSTATKPTPTADEEGVTLEYTDTGDMFRWTGAYWFQTHSKGAVIIDPGMQKAAFGELTTAEPTPIVQLNFNYNINTELANVFANNGSASIVNNMLAVSTGAGAAQSCVVNSKVAIKYFAGHGVRVRCSGMFTTAAAGSFQYVGGGDQGDGLFFGYKDTNFGVMKRSAGLPEVRVFTITTASTTAESVTVTLDGDTILVPVTNSGNVTTTANELGAADYSDVGSGWDAHVDGADVEYFSYDADPKVGAFSLTATTAVANVTTKITGVIPAELFVAQTDWNRDKADGTGSLPDMSSLWTNGNVFQIQYQWLGFGMIRFAVEDPSTGLYVPVHEIEYAGANSIPSLGNPNLQLCAVASNSTNTTDMVVSVGSMGGFIEGRTNGAHFHNGESNLLAYVSATEKPVLTVHNKRTYNSKMNKIRIRLIFTSVATDGTKNVSFKYKYNGTLTDAVFTEVEPGISVVEVDTSATAITGGDEQFTVVKAKVDSEVISLANSSFFLNPGDFITITAQSAGNSLVEASLNWEELF